LNAPNATTTRNDMEKEIHPLATKPSDCLLIRSIFDTCPETNEPQAVHAFRMIDGVLIFETRGKTRAWRHRITTEEIDLPNRELSEPKSVDKHPNQ
jgi:hypothetical protein